MELLPLMSEDSRRIIRELEDTVIIEGNAYAGRRQTFEIFGAILGKHYHRKMVEQFTVTAGTLQFDICQVDPTTHEALPKTMRHLRLNQGDTIVVRPFEAHRVVSDGPAAMSCLCSTRFDPGDIIPIEVDWGANA